MKQRIQPACLVALGLTVALPMTALAQIQTVIFAGADHALEEDLSVAYAGVQVGRETGVWTPVAGLTGVWVNHPLDIRSDEEQTEITVRGLAPTIGLRRRWHGSELAGSVGYGFFDRSISGSAVLLPVGSGDGLFAQLVGVHWGSGVRRGLLYASYALEDDASHFRLRGGQRVRSLPAGGLYIGPDVGLHHTRDYRALVAGAFVEATLTRELSAGAGAGYRAPSPSRADGPYFRLEMTYIP